MDSGNSSSMQSSSGGDDQEYDSRSFFPTIPPPPPPPPPQPPLNNPNLLFNPTFLNPFSDRDLFTWPPPPPPLLRSDPTPNTNYLSFSGDFPTTPSSSAAAPPPPPPPPKPAPGPIKNPKKRTRASRRAPTTILTTDTTNFRAMVQEFTGIPDPPFSGAGSVYSRRLDLLGSAGSSMRLAAALGGPLRPTAQRLPPANSNNAIQEMISQTGSGRVGPDPVLAFQTLLNQSNHQIGYQPQPPPLHNAAFGINIGLLGSDSHLSDAIGLDPHQHQHQHGVSSGNNENSINYVMSCGAMTSSPSTDLIRPEEEYRNE